MNTLKKYLTHLPVLIVAAYITIFVALLMGAVFTDAPREFRDAANVSLSVRFANMQNPYILSDEYEFIESINVYPPVNMGIAAFLYILTGINLYRIFYCLDFIYIFITAVVITCFVKRELKVSLFPALLTFACTLTLGWRTGFISTVPDHLGMLICVLLLISVYKNKNVYLQAFLTVLAFYSKQYFLAVAAGIFLYYLFHNRKKALLYFLSTSAMGISSFAIISLIFPSFSVQILFFLFAETKEITLDNIFYSLKQMLLAFVTYGIYTLLILKRYVLFIRRFFSRQKISFSVFDFNSILMFFILLYLGTNKGAFLSYHLTLMLPSLLITGTVEIHALLQKAQDKIKYPLELLICIISLALLYKKYQFPYIYTQNDYQNYILAESILEEYQQGEVYLVPQLGYYALEQQLLPDENGHEHMISLADSKIINTPINISDIAGFFPYINNMYAYSVTRKEEIIVSVKNHVFSLILRPSDSSLLYGFDISEYYECIESIPLRTGSQNYGVDFWIPKE